MNCPRCGGNVYCKDGIVQGRQRYLCKGCRYRYTVKQRCGVGSEAIKRQALELYLEGLGFRSIGRILKFSNVSILNWIKAFGESLAEIKNDKPIQVMEIDEMHSYVGSKKTLAGYGLLLIEMKESSSIAYWVPGRKSRARNFGIASDIGQ
jgi:transposase-like protein